LCVPNDQTLREKVMTEAHSSPFTIHPGSKLNNRGLVVVTALWIPMWQWDEISMDFFTWFAYYSEKDMMRFGGYD
ncbi:hypothetical protein Tco_1028775, partial [Tanacetum coccineum]